MDGSLSELLRRDCRPRILVVGDVMLDRYLWGDVQRISPEAPIPVLRVAKQEERLGGAGNVAAMLAALEADATLVATVGDDAEGRKIRRLLDGLGISHRCVLTAAGRESTVKERFLGRTHSKHPQQILRVDREQDRPFHTELTEQLLDAVRAALRVEGSGFRVQGSGFPVPANNQVLNPVLRPLSPLPRPPSPTSRIDLVLISDYAKGVCAGEFIPRVVAMCLAAGVPVLADPVRGADYRRYAGCTCITPNRTEAGAATGMDIVTPEDGLEAARRLLRFGVESAVVTLDRHGMAWADRRGNARLFPVRPREVYDVTGAGDMVLSTLGYCLAAGADFPSAIELANLAGGLEVERLGVVLISRRELLAELTARAESTPADAATAEKIVSVETLQAELTRRRQLGQRIAMTNGCFDLLHPGHVASLQEARRHGDCLVVGLNSDRGVRELKGPERPIIDQQGRAEMLAALACVDYVVLFDEADVTGLVEKILPDVLVKSAEYRLDEIVGHEIIERHGGRIVRVAMKGPYSTRRLIDKIRSPVSDACVFAVSCFRDKKSSREKRV